MIFLDKEHEEFYNSNIEKTKSAEDPYRKALFYTLGLTEETRRNINTLYDYKERIIRFEGLNKGWQTGTSTKVTRLAFNLFNGFAGDTGGEDTKYDGSDFTPYYLFGNSLMPYMFEAVKLLYSCYASQNTTE